MANWSDVGDWLKNNAGTGAALVGSLLTGNMPGVVAAGVALVGSATGTANPSEALAQLQTDPLTVVRLRELAIQDEANIREHIRTMTELQLKDKQAEHEQTQQTIRSGDNAEDEYVRHTRPSMARQSWYAAAGYVIAFQSLKAFDIGDGASFDLSILLMTPAAAYLGLREIGKGLTTWRKA